MTLLPCIKNKWICPAKTYMLKSPLIMENKHASLILRNHVSSIHGISICNVPNVFVLDTSRWTHWAKVYTNPALPIACLSGKPVEGGVDLVPWRGSSRLKWISWHYWITVGLIVKVSFNGLSEHLSCAIYNAGARRPLPKPNSICLFSLCSLVKILYE